jgi:hypothetical protein
MNHFVQSDAGRSLSKRPKQKNDCTVRAVVEATGIAYDAAYDILKEAGRKCSTGFHFKDWAATNPLEGFVFKWKPFQAVKGERRMNPVKFCETHPTGTYILKTAKHVFAVKNGKIYDTFCEHDERCVYGCWEVVKA